MVKENISHLRTTIEVLQQENKELKSQLSTMKSRVKSAFKLRFPHHGIFAKNYELFMDDITNTNSNLRESSR